MCIFRNHYTLLRSRKVFVPALLGCIYSLASSGVGGQMMVRFVHRQTTAKLTGLHQSLSLSQLKEVTAIKLT